MQRKLLKVIMRQMTVAVIPRSPCVVLLFSIGRDKLMCVCLYKMLYFRLFGRCVSYGQYRALTKCMLKTRSILLFLSDLLLKNIQIEQYINLCDFCHIKQNRYSASAMIFYLIFLRTHKYLVYIYFLYYNHAVFEILYCLCARCIINIPLSDMCEFYFRCIKLKKKKFSNRITWKKNCLHYSNC